MTVKEKSRFCYGIITNQSAAFDPHSDVGPVYIKTKCLQLRRDNLTRDLGSCNYKLKTGNG
jgi:hypothetical protein